LLVRGSRCEFAKDVELLVLRVGAGDASVLTAARGSMSSSEGRPLGTYEAGLTNALMTPLLR